MGWDGVAMGWDGMGLGWNDVEIGRDWLELGWLAGWLWAGLGSASICWTLTAKPLGLGGRKGLVLEFL